MAGRFRQDRPLTGEGGGWVKEGDREDAGGDFPFVATTLIDRGATAREFRSRDGFRSDRQGLQSGRRVRLRHRRRGKLLGHVDQRQPDDRAKAAAPVFQNDVAAVVAGDGAGN